MADRKWQILDETPTRADVQLVEAVLERNAPLWELRYLIRAGANVNVLFRESANGGSNTLLHYVGGKGWVEALELLIEAGAGLETRVGNGYTPFLTSAMSGNGEVLRALVGAGADWTAQTEFGSTALHNAARAIDRLKPNVDPVLFLMELGLDHQKKNKQGTTAFEASRPKGNIKVFGAAAAVAKSLPLLKLEEGEVIDKEKLFQADGNGKTFLDHPATWHSIWQHLPEPLTKAELQQTNSGGKSLLAFGIECRQLGPIMKGLAAHGERLEFSDLIDGQGQATDALEAICKRQQVDALLNERLGLQFSSSQLKRIYLALPGSGKEQLGNYHQLLAVKTRQERSQILSYNYLGR